MNTIDSVRAEFVLKKAMPFRRRSGAIRTILYPPLAARFFVREGEPDDQRWWRMVSIALFFPLTAILHHLIFLPQHCMLATVGSDYDPMTIGLWLTRDPSPAWGALLALAVHQFGLRLNWVRMLAAPFFISFLPLSIWLWDLPGTGTVICRTFHDGKLVLFGDTSLRTAHLHLLGAATWAVLFGLLVLEKRRLELRAARPSRRGARVPVILRDPAAWVASSGSASEVRGESSAAR